MHVVINALAATGGGTATYFRDLIPELGKVAPGDRFTVLTAPWQTIWDFEWPRNSRQYIAPLPRKRVVPLRIAWEQVGLPRMLRREGADLLYSASDIATLATPCPVVLAVRNPNPYFPGKTRYGLRYVGRNVALKALTRVSIRRARAVIFVSQHSRDTVMAQLPLPPGKAHVVYHGLGAHFLDGSSASDRNQRFAVPFEQDQPYVLSVSDIMEHKNYPLLIQAFARLYGTMGTPHHLVLAGRLLYRPHVLEIRKIAVEAGLGDRVHLIGQVPNPDMPALYRGAALFVLPSLLETFGHTLVEAMASGVPVVAAKASAIPEICGDGAVYFDPTSEEDAAMAMEGVLSDEALRRQMIERGQKRARSFSWERCARETVRVFEQALGEAGA